MVSRFINGIWETPVKIGKGDFFKICGTGKDFFIIAIKEKAGDICLKKIVAENSVKTVESFSFIKSAERILDISFLAYDEGLFCAYIVKTMFSVQIWFKEGGRGKKEIFVCRRYSCTSSS